MHGEKKMKISLLLRTLTSGLHTLMTVESSTSTAVQFSIELAGQITAVSHLEPFVTKVAVP